MENWFAGFAERYPVFPGLMEAAVESAGTGLRPRPVGGRWRFCRGRPVCRPGYGFSRNLLTGGHIGPPLRGVGRRSEPTEIGAGRKPSPTGRDGARPLPGSRSRAVRPGRRGVVTPPYGCKTGSAKQQADVGIGPYGRSERFQQPPGPAAHSGASAPAVARKWVEIAAEIIPKVSSNFGQSLSHGCAVPAPFTQGSLRRRGMRIAASALRASSQ